MRPRFRIAGMLAAVVCCGVAFAALRSPSQLWAATLFAVALGSLPVGLIHALYSRGRRRAFWVGFLACGAVYLAASLGPGIGEVFGPRMVTTAVLDLLYPRVFPPAVIPPAGLAGDVRARVAEQLLLAALEEQLVATRRVAVSPNDPASLSLRRRLDRLQGRLAPAPTSRWSAWAAPDHTGGNTTVGGVPLVAPETFRRIGHSLWTLLVAALGGVFARARYDARDGDRP